MPIDTTVAVGAALPDRTFSWTESDVLLYHLGIGAGSRTGDNVDAGALRYTLDDDQLQVLPSFGVVAPTFHETTQPSLDLPGCDIDLQMVLHGSQEVVVHAPIPASGTATLKTTISDVWDKGKAAVIVQLGEPSAWTASISGPSAPPSSCATKEVGAVTVAPQPRSSSPSARPTPRRRTPSLPTRHCSTASVATATPCMLTRRSPRAQGSPRRSCTGLCSYGIVLREVTDLLLDGDAARVGGFSARFAGVVFPGETVRVQAWDEGDRVVISATIASEHEQRDGSPVLADCVLTKA